MIKILIADDHPIVLDGLCSAINSTEGLEVIGTATNGEEAIRLIESLNPDVVLTDISMPVLTGIELTREVSRRFDNVKVIIMSMHENDAYINNAVKAGVHGYLLKDAEKKELIEAIFQVNAGGKFFSKTVSQIMENTLYNQSRETGATLSEGKSILSNREIEVLQMIVYGLSNKEIAAKLFLSTRTIDAHRYNIMQKLEVKNTAEMIKTAVKLKLVEF